MAQFIGTPQMNILPSTQWSAAIKALAPAAAKDGAIGLRPESVVVGSDANAKVQGKVDLVEALGAETLVYITTNEGAQLVARQSERTPLHMGDAVSADLALEKAHWFDSNGRVVKATVAA